MLTIQRIVCPVDFSACAIHALEYAQDLARLFDAELCMVHAYEDPAAYVTPVPMSGYVGPGAELLLELRKQLELRLDATAAKVKQSGIRARAELLEGTPYRVVIDWAKEYNADLIVIGTHGHTGFTHALLGSVTERVVRMAECPVLTIRTPE
ncbi:MAG TPA: universal stress protein [Polyangiales bacterium]|nr:universal stress protein [Polyangiales bacterium]